MTCQVRKQSRMVELNHINTHTLIGIMSSEYGTYIYSFDADDICMLKNYLVASPSGTCWYCAFAI